MEAAVISQNPFKEFEKSLTQLLDKKLVIAQIVEEAKRAAVEFQAQKEAA